MIRDYNTALILAPITKEQCVEAMGVFNHVIADSLTVVPVNRRHVPIIGLTAPGRD